MNTYPNSWFKQRFNEYLQRCKHCDFPLIPQTVYKIVRRTRKKKFLKSTGKQYGLCTNQRCPRFVNVLKNKSERA